MTEMIKSWGQEVGLAGRQEWLAAGWHAGPIAGLMLGLFYYWFGVADRYSIFLYNHLGSTPFDPVTRSRYWMAGLVAAGLVTGLYIPINWLLGQAARVLRRPYEPPPVWPVWLLAGAPLAIGIPAITMTVNQPTLPANLAAGCFGAAWPGLGLALLPGAIAGRRPAGLAWFCLDGLGLAPVLLLLRAVELPGRGLISPATAWSAALGGLVAGLAWLAVVSRLRAWRRQPPGGAAIILAAGLWFSYLVLPLVHHLLFVPPDFRYISTASNFFAFEPGVQLLCFAVAGAMALGVETWRRYLAAGKFLLASPAQ